MGKLPLPPYVAKMVPGTAGVGIFRKEALVPGTAELGVFSKEALVPDTAGVGILRKEASVLGPAEVSIFRKGALVPGTAGVGIFRKEALASHAKLPTRIGYARFPLSAVLGQKAEKRYTGCFLIVKTLFSPLYPSDSEPPSAIVEE